MKITDEVASQLGFYVYIYSDPRDNKPFYIGKGKGNRLFQHLDEMGSSRKIRMLNEIRDAGYTPKIDLLRYGLTDSQATLVEACAIDLIGKDSLTNIQGGHETVGFARISSADVITMLTAEPVDVIHRSMLITINKLYKSDLSEIELYHSTRGIWKVGERRNSVDYAMAVYQGIVRAVYSVDSWYPAGTTDYGDRDISEYKGTGRWEFIGCLAPKDISELYVGKSVGKGGQNPIRYLNI